MFKSVKLISLDVMEESEACIMYNNASAASFFFSSPKRKCERLLTGRKFEARSVDLHLTESNRLDELAFFIVLKSFMELKPRGYHTLFRHVESCAHRLVLCPDHIHYCLYQYNGKE